MNSLSNSSHNYSDANFENSKDNSSNDRISGIGVHEGNNNQVPVHEVVRMRTHASDNDDKSNRDGRAPLASQRTSCHHKEPRDVILAFRISRTLADRIESYITNNKSNTSKTLAVTTLIETGLFVVEHAARLQDPAMVKYFQDNLYNVQLVDDIMEWPQDRIEALLGVLASERERRIRIRIGRK